MGGQLKKGTHMPITGYSRWSKRSQARLCAVVVMCAAWASLGAAVAQASGGAAQPLSSTPSATQPYTACPPTPAGVAACQAVIIPAGAKLDSVSPDSVSPASGGIDGSGLAPAELQAAYKLPSSSAGAGQTVALVDAYNDPTAEADLGAYRSAYGLPECTTANGCFDKVSQTGSKSYPPQPSAEEGDWPVEESLDVDMASAICPNCHIMLVEANSASLEDLTAAENEAAKLGATEISNSWASFEFEGETSFDKDFDHPGVPITAASGDWGYDNDEYDAQRPSYPAASPDVIAVGGTDLSASDNSRGWTETVWPRSGSGCSLLEPKPSYQTDSGCSKRTTNDIAAVAEDLSIYDTSGTTGEGKLAGWYTVGGTSAATPVIAAVEALSGSEARSLGASAFYKSPSSFFAVTSGSNGSCGGSYLCTGGSGYRGPTGVGTPDGVIPAGSGSSAPVVSSVAGPSNSDPDGSVEGGTAVVIKGSGFTGASAVDFGAKAAASFKVLSSSEIDATSPAASHTAGYVNVTVVGPSGTSAASEGDQFVYVPDVKSMTPTSGSVNGGTQITLTGTGFDSDGGVEYVVAGTLHYLTSLKVVSEDEVTGVVPASAKAEAVTVVVVMKGQSGQHPPGVASPPEPFTYESGTPTVSSVSPSSGSTAGGSAVTIDGSGFVKGATVKIGSKASSVTVRSETEITAVTPSGSAGSDEVVVSDERGSSSGGPRYTFVAPIPPAVSSIAPAEGSTHGGTAVTIKGSGFVKGASVKIGSKASSVTVRSETEITAVTPSGFAGSDEVVVGDERGSSSGGPRYEFVAPPVPTVSSITPAEGSTHGGTAVTIKGTAFLAGATVKIGGKATSVKVRSETEITAVTPSYSAGRREVVVGDENGTTSGGPSFTYVAPPAPTVSSISPAEGPTTGGSAVTIKGTGFLGGSTVKIGKAALSVSVRSATEITARTPSDWAGHDEVIVSNENGSSSGGPSYTYVTPAPSATTTVTLHCVGARACSGTVQLTAGDAIAASRKAGARAATATIAAGAFSIAAGRAADVTLALSAAGRALVSSARGGVNVTLSVLPSSGSPSPAHAENVHLHLIRRAHRAGRLVRSAASKAGRAATVLVGGTGPRARRP
jgi:IPT/TIG domain